MFCSHKEQNISPTKAGKNRAVPTQRMKNHSTVPKKFSFQKLIMVLDKMLAYYCSLTSLPNGRNQSKRHRDLTLKKVLWDPAVTHGRMMHIMYS